MADIHCSIAEIDKLEIEKQQLEADLMLTQEKYKKLKAYNNSLVEQDKEGEE